MSLKLRGFSLGELLLSIALLGLALLALLALVSTALRSDKKSSLMTTGSEIALTQLERAIASARSDSPAGSRAAFWENDYVSTPLATGKVIVSRTEFTYEVFATTIKDAATGADLGTSTATSNRVKKVDVVVSWYSKDRQGYGTLNTQISRLINEAATP